MNFFDIFVVAIKGVLNFKPKNSDSLVFPYNSLQCFGLFYLINYKYFFK